MKYTRKDYLAGVCNHAEYYSQFVTKDVTHIVVNRIGHNNLMHSTDEHLNDIPLIKWDKLHHILLPIVGRSLSIANGMGVSLSDTVCVAKQAARLYIDSQKEA